MVWPSASWAQSSEHYRRFPGQTHHTGTCSLINFYTGTAGVQILTKNDPFKVLYCAKSRFSEENKVSIQPSTKEARELELAIALAYVRKERYLIWWQNNES